MISNETRVVIDQAKAIYERYREALEAEHRDQFVAIEPVSGDRFVADSFNAAVRAARSAHPSRLSHTIRIGHDAVFHIGLMEQSPIQIRNSDRDEWKYIRFGRNDASCGAQTRNRLLRRDRHFDEETNK